MLTAASLGVELQIAAPPSRQPDATLVAAAQALHPRGADGVRVGTDPRAAVAGAHAVHTDTWVSMGQEGAMTEAQVRHVFEPYRVDDALLALADPSAVFLHCLPAEPGNEVTPAVLRGPRSLILDQAENRLWTTKAVLAHHVFPRPTT
jgi:ornithine carbamoyltransferase